MIAPTPKMEILLMRKSLEVNLYLLLCSYNLLVCTMMSLQDFILYEA